MKIVFLLPGQSLKPAGGFKVVYEYANRLVGRGHEVTVVHPWDCTRPGSPLAAARARLWAARLRRRPARIAPWFELDQRVTMGAIEYPVATRLPAADVLIATAWHTASWVDAAAPERGAGFYLIQGYETWDGEIKRVRETWRLPLRKIVISRWLEAIAAELGEAERTVRVPIGMDLDRLGVDVPLERREKRVGALLNAGREKGREDIIAALVALKQHDAAVEARLFGTAPRPAELPAWAEYEMLPSAERLRALYNSCAVFLQASRSEGWGLPPCEAMLCGCALVTVDNGGSREFARDRETALVVPPEQCDQLAERVAELLGDEGLRIRLARAGAELVRGFTWERSVAALEDALVVAVAEDGAAA